MIIDVYADVVCPWCYIGARRLEQAIALRTDLPVGRRWRPFQLQPYMLAGGLPWPEFTRRKFGREERAKAAFARVSAVGTAEGIRFDFDRVVSAPNTVDAHRLILLATRSGSGWEMVDALFEAYFADGRDLNDHEDLASVAAGVGLDTHMVRAHLADDEDVAEVKASQREADQLGVAGVPFYVIDERYVLSGAQPVEVFIQALDLVYAG